jgi:molecular chaperone IbpA
MTTFPYGKNMLPATVGFERLFSTIEEIDKAFANVKPQSYPPYNIIRSDENNYEIHIAVAGFDKDNIVIETKENKLSVNGVIDRAETEVVYLHHGLASRDFRHVFTLSDTVIVKSADIINGILKIALENVIPEEKKPRLIPIGKENPMLTNDK